MIEPIQKSLNKFDPSLFLNQELINQFICPICKGVLIEPAMDLCGCQKLFCKNCLENYLKSHDNICFISGNKSLQNPLYIKWVEEHIKLYDVKCQNFLSGCSWTGKFSNYEEHILECPKELLICTYEGCNEKIYRENYDKHIDECKFKPITIKYKEK